MPFLASKFQKDHSNVVLAIPIAAASVDVPVFIADRQYKVSSIKEIHSVVGGTSAAVKVRKCAGTTAPASGTELHATAFDLTATVNTLQTATVVAADALVKKGERLVLDFSGTLTGLAGTVTIVLRPA